MKLLDITALASCAALVLSQPLEKRVLVVETVYTEVFETVDETTTYYVQPGDHAPSAGVTPEVVVISSPVAAPAPVSTPIAIAPKPVYTPAFQQKQKHKHTKKSSVTPISSPIETVTPVVAPVITPLVEPVVTPEASSAPVITPVVAPVVTPEASSAPVITPVVAPVVAPVVTSEASSAPAVQTPQPASPQEQLEYSFSAQPAPTVTPEAQAPAPPSSPSDGACGTVGGKCSGDLTYYDTGLGACGWTNDGNTEAVFALAHGMMGEQSNGNPYCGRFATVVVDGKSVVCKLVDKCMGCEGQSIDVSNMAFDQLADRSVGRLHNVEWYFND